MGSSVNMPTNPTQSALIREFQGMRPAIATDAFIAENAVLIGDVTVGPRASIWYGCVLRGDINEIRVGAETNIQDGTVVHVDSKGYPTHIGDRVTIGHMALIHACTLKDGCMVGMRATVMDGAVVGEGAMIAAGALVTPGKQVPPGELWAGQPARKLRDMTPKDKDMLDYIWPNYVDYARAFMDDGFQMSAPTGFDKQLMKSSKGEQDG